MYRILFWRCRTFVGAIEPRRSGEIVPKDEAGRVICSMFFYHLLQATMKPSVFDQRFQNSAALAGMAAGPFFFAPISHIFGRSATIFWCVCFTLVCQVWAAVMTGANDYIPFVISRLFAGFFGAVPTVLGPRIVTDMFFLHQRGRAFNALHMAFLFGTIAGPTFSGFVSAHSFFPVEFWWTVGLLGFTLLCCFSILEETGFDRESLDRNPDIPSGIVANRFATFFFGQNVVLATTWKETVCIWSLIDLFSYYGSRSDMI